jgi:prolyl-tRNA synthetase
MKLSKSFWKTYKEKPADAEIPSHVLMTRAGLISKSGSGIYNLLPFGLRSIRKIENIIRKHLESIGSMEISMSVVTPGELWKESGRWQGFGSEMLKFSDKLNKDLCISPTNEEAVTDIFRKSVKSYKDLPVSLYQINTKFRDEIRPRFGVMRGREFIMKDAYTFHADKPCLDREYDNFYKAYEQIFSDLGLEYRVVEADAGAMAGPNSKTHEFQVLADTGEDQLIYSKGYGANIETAKTKKVFNCELLSSPAELELIETPNEQTCEQVSSLLGINVQETLKSLVFKSITGEKSELVVAVVVGDDEVNEVKLKNFLKSDFLQVAPEVELSNSNLVKGFIGPVNLVTRVVFDQQIPLDKNFVIGGNKTGYHQKNFKIENFYDDAELTDLRMSQAGDLDLEGNTIDICRGIEVGHIFQLGDKYTKALNTTILDKNGKAMNPLMGCYGIGVSRILGAAIEQSHDEKGIIWPKSISPFELHFVSISKSEEFSKISEEIYDSLKKAGIDVIYDDRKVGPGFKFKDADLLGVPLQLVFGERDYKENKTLSYINRKTGEKTIVNVSELLEQFTNLNERL